jgi:hypothetical protein
MVPNVEEAFKEKEAVTARDELIAKEAVTARDELIAKEAEVAEPVKLPLMETSYPPFDVKAEYSCRISFGWIVFPFTMLELFKVAMVIYLD